MTYDATSESHPLNCGVPQGSMLHLPLYYFDVYVADNFLFQLIFVFSLIIHYQNKGKTKINWNKN